VDGEGRDVPSDGATLGEVALHGNNVMLGYYRDAAATAQAMPDGWLRTGDLGVLHPDGYLEIRDRAKDIIISGGRTSPRSRSKPSWPVTPRFLEVAVVSTPSEKWGERPIAWVTLKDGREASGEELRQHVRARLAAFKVPDRIELVRCPRPRSGKIRKVDLRERAAGSVDHAERGSSST